MVFKLHKKKQYAKNTCTEKIYLQNAPSFDELTVTRPFILAFFYTSKRFIYSDALGTNSLNLHA